MKRIITLILVLVLTTSIGARAESNIWQNELGRSFSIGEVRTTKPGGYGTVIYEHLDETRAILFKPTSVKVEAQRTSFVVYANVTTASPLIAVQWSTDPAFKKDVHTKFFKNSGCRGKVYVNVVSHYDRNVSPLTTWTRQVYQGKTKFDYRQMRLDDDHTLDTTQWLINRMRQKVALTRRLYVPDVKNPTRYYVRLRNSYDGQYSPWSAVVKVR